MMTMSVDLSSKYLGLPLKNPLVAASSSLTEKLDSLRRLEDAGVAAAVLTSLFEEQFAHDEIEMTKLREFGADSFAEALSYFPEQEDYRFGPDAYLDAIGAAKRALSIPIIGSLNGVSQGGWLRYAKLIQEAGADALELNIYFIAADVDMSGAEVEQQYLDLVAAVRESVSIPLSVKIGPYFSSPAHMAKRLVDAGADGLVLFNRYLQPDFDLDQMTTTSKLVLSTPFELLVPLRWVAIVYGRVKASLALSSGVHNHECVLKALLAGADVVQVGSLLYKQSLDQLGTLLQRIKDWMAEKEYDSVEQLKGSMSQQNCPDPTALARGNYMKALTSFTGPPI
jgi:dihydroorotate dehydrogenase (fumarate)